MGLINRKKVRSTAVSFGSSQTTGIISVTAEEYDNLVRETTRLTAENMRLHAELEIQRITIRQENQQAEALRQDVAELPALRAEAQKLQEDNAVMYQRIKDLDTQLSYFFEEMPPFVAEKWIERWQALTPPPLETRFELLADGDEVTAQHA